MHKFKVLGTFFTLLLLSVLISQMDERLGDGLHFIPRGFSITADWTGGRDRLSSLETFKRVLYYIKESYVEPERIRPQTMFKKILDSLATSIPEVRTFYPSQDKAVLVVDDARKEFETQIPNLYGLQSATSDALKFIRSNKKSDVLDSDLETVSISAALATLDPHSVYLSRESYNETKVGTSGEFGGLGIVIGMRDAKLTIIVPLADTPAARAALKAGDQILKIGDELTAGMLLTEAVDKMRGPKGTPVTLNVLRKGWTIPRNFTLVRDKINIVSVESELIPTNIGYVRIKNFQKNTEKDLSFHLQKLTHRAGGALKGLILDLRNDPGGLLDQAIAVADKFLADGVIVKTVGANNVTLEEERAVERGTEPNYPMIVLVNTGSASASEIVAGALQRRGRALVIGSKTFGKGTVQSLFDLPEKSALKLTIAKYLTPGDISIQSIGIYPEVSTTAASISKEQIDLFPSEHIPREVSLEHHFANPSATPHSFSPIVSLRYLDDKSEKEKAEEESQTTLSEGSTERIQKFLEDFDVRYSVNVLNESKGGNKTELEALAKKLAEKAQKQETQKMVSALAKKEITWTAPPKEKPKKCGTPKLSAGVIGKLVSFAKAGDTIRFSVKLENHGPCTLYKAWALSSSQNYLFDDHEFLFGKVLPATSITREVKIEIPKATPTNLAQIQLHFSEGRGITIPDLRSQVAIASIPNPEFAFHYEINDRNNSTNLGNGNGFLERGETIELKLKIKNIGKTPTEEGSASIKETQEKYLKVKIGRAPLPRLQPGEEKTVFFNFEIPNSYPEKTLGLEVSLADFVYRIFQTKKISFDVYFGSPDGKAPGDVKQNLFQPPTIQMTSIEDKIFKPTTDQFFRLAGEIADDIGVKDIFILVNQKKVFYQNFLDPKNIKDHQKFDANIPLIPGMNRILLVARDSEDLVYRKALIVQRVGVEKTNTLSNASTERSVTSPDEYLLDPGF